MPGPQERHPHAPTETPQIFPSAGSPANPSVAFSLQVLSKPNVSPLPSGQSGEWPLSPAPAHGDSLAQSWVSHSPLLSIPTPVPPANTGYLTQT